MHRRAHAEATEMVLGQPHRVVAGAVHDLDPVERAGEHRFERHAPFRPAEELQDTELHCAASPVRPDRLSPRGTVAPVEPYAVNTSVALNAARAGTMIQSGATRSPA